MRSVLLTMNVLSDDVAALDLAILREDLDKLLLCSIFWKIANKDRLLISDRSWSSNWLGVWSHGHISWCLWNVQVGDVWSNNDLV